MLNTPVIRSCVIPPGTFHYGIHKPQYTVKNLRRETSIQVLGRLPDGTAVENQSNYPETDVQVDSADWIFEIPNPFPFRGRTYIDKQWADNSATNPSRIGLQNSGEVSLSSTEEERGLHDLIEALDRPLQLGLATTSTDPRDLIRLARLSCDFAEDETGLGLSFRYDDHGQLRPVIHDHDLFEAVANNPHLPEEYRIAMVIRPGAQGRSEIVGDWRDGTSHIYEYLRRNSYIAGGHYAANLAEDGIRYSTRELTAADITGLRHLYYQRTYVRLAEIVGMETSDISGRLDVDQLERLRTTILSHDEQSIAGLATLWGWNYGFDFAPTGYRLHASHQQIHQQYALILDRVEGSHGNLQPDGPDLQPYCCGDLIGDWILRYREMTGRNFFSDYRRAIETNQRMDARQDRSADLVVWQDERVMVFVPKAQTSQWEVQIMILPGPDGNIAGNILECDTATRASLDHGLLLAQKALDSLGVKMVTSIEFSKRIGSSLHQPLLYSLLPKLPQSPGAFSEAQLRFINGHYPEDFAARLREQLNPR